MAIIFSPEWWKEKVHKQDGKNILIASKSGDTVTIQSGANLEDGMLTNTGDPITFTAGGGGKEYTAGDNIVIDDTEISVNPDVTIDNLFANDEIEFASEDGDFGTNAKARITSTIVGADNVFTGTNNKFTQGVEVEGTLYSKTELQIDGTIMDAYGEVGTNGQFLTSTGTGIAWVTVPSANGQSF